MDSAERLLKLLGLLEGRIDWTAVDLARRLDVTTRTIRRDVGRLRSLGYPVESLSGPGGGYRLGAGGKLPPLLLDDGEALAVALGLRLTVRATVGGLEESSLSALSKLEHLLPPRLRTRLEDVSIATVSTLGPSRTLVDHRIFSTAAAAIRIREKLRFAYVDGEGKRSRRHVEPVRLVHTGRRWYLVSFDLDREGWRTFRLDRVSDANATGIRFSIRNGPDPVTLVQSGLAIDVWVHRAVVALSVGLDQALRVIPATIGAIEPIDGSSCRLIIGADDLDWLARYLLGLPFEFAVEEPDGLKSQLAKIGSDLVAEYEAV